MNKLLTEQELESFLKRIYYQGKDGKGYSDSELKADVLVIQSQKQAHADTVIEDENEEERNTLEYLQEILDDDADDDHSTIDFAKGIIKEKLGYLLPRNHKDYWKYHCPNCGLWTGHEMEDLGMRYCDCE